MRPANKYTTYFGLFFPSFAKLNGYSAMMGMHISYFSKKKRNSFNLIKAGSCWLQREFHVLFDHFDVRSLNTDSVFMLGNCAKRIFICQIINLCRRTRFLFERTATQIFCVLFPLTHHQRDSDCKVSLRMIRKKKEPINFSNQDSLLIKMRICILCIWAL